MTGILVCYGLIIAALIVSDGLIKAAQALASQRNGAGE